MRILVIGGSGMLGHKLVQILGSQFDVWTTIRAAYSDVERFGIFDPARVIAGVDLTNSNSVPSAIRAANPEVVINAAGLIKQVPESADSVLMLKINSIFPQALAELAIEHGFRLITVSTDCVFNGKRGNYSELDKPDAKDLYGVSKRLGELNYPNCLTLRTSIIGRELHNRHALVEWFLDNRGETVNGYAKAIYSGFPTFVLAQILLKIVSDHPKLQGTYHVSSDPINKFELLNLLNEYYCAGVRIERSDDVVIDRSLDSSAFRKITGFSPANWEQMIEQMASDPTPYEKWKK